MKGLNVFLLVALALVLIMVRDTESKRMTIEDARKTIKNLRKVCAKKTGATKELIDGQFKGEFPKEESLMCYMRCVLVSTKAMKNEQVSYDFFLTSARMMLVEELIPRAEQVIATCRPLVEGDDGCEVAWSFGKCIWEHDKEMYISP